MSQSQATVFTQSSGHIRIAKIFVNDNRNKIRYIHGLGWHYWCGTHWKADTDGRHKRLATETVGNARRLAADMEDNVERKALWKDANLCSLNSGLNGMLDLAKNYNPVSTGAEFLDNDPYLFNTRNGTLDLRTGELLRHKQEDLITKVAGCGYYPDAEGVTFLRFLEEILPDLSIREYVQRLVGYSMLGTVKEHVLPLFIGAGRNGKSKLLEVILKAFGDYGLMAAPTLLLEKNSNAATTDKVDLFGKRLVVCSETDEGNRFAAATVKNLTGGDVIRARKMYKDNIDFSPSHTIFMMTNHEPRTDGSDSAMFERIRKVLFEQKFIGARQDPSLSEKLALELDVVLRWAVEGYQKYIEQGLKPPIKVVSDTERYQLANDKLGRFLKERTVESDGSKVGVTDLWNTWNEWNGYSNNGAVVDITHNSNTIKLFSERVEARGFQKTHTNKGNVFKGIGLLRDTDRVDLGYGA